MNNTHSAIILDDHKLFGDLFGLMLEKAGLFKYVYVFDNKVDFFNLLTKLGNKEVHLFIDYYFGEENGLVILNDARRINAKANTIFITSALSPQAIQHVYLAKPHAILSKSSSLPELKECLESINKHKIYLDPVMQNILSKTDQLDVLTAREIEILKYFENGYSVAMTAEKTFLSKHTIVAHRRNMMRKTKSNSISQLLKHAQTSGII